MDTLLHDISKIELRSFLLFGFAFGCFVCLCVMNSKEKRKMIHDEKKQDYKRSK